MAPRNILYAQSGGPTPVINATACGVIQTAQKHPEITRVYAAQHGILGVLNENLIDTYQEDPNTIDLLKHTPGAAFGSCRYKLPDLNTDTAPYERFLAVIKAHNIGTFFYNGGGDSHDTIHKLSRYCHEKNYPLTCIGLPKTIDNDLPITDNSPGFGSVAKYIATTTQEIDLDLASMALTSTKVFILEVMGRHAGWITAASALAKRHPNDAPHLLLLPEVAFDPQAFIQAVKRCVDTVGYCFVCASEGIQHADGRLVSETGEVDAFGHHQLGGLAPKLAHLIKRKLGYKYHWAVSDYCQRAAAHTASLTDVTQAYALGEAAVERSLQGLTDVMLTIQRDKGPEYNWRIGTAHLKDVANREVCVPRDMISEDNFSVTQACLDYLRPLIQGEVNIPHENGLPQYASLAYHTVQKRLCAYSV